MALPFGLAEMQFFEERAGRAELFLDRAVEFFRLLAEPRDVREHGFWRTREGRRGLRWPRHGGQSSLLISTTQGRLRSHPGVVPEYE
jgi:hypothetical protein